MSGPVFVVGASGRTGLRTVKELLKRGVEVRAMVRRKEGLPEDVSANERCTVIVGSILEVPEDELEAHLKGCQAVVSCLGHNMTFTGVFFPPRSLVTDAGRRICRCIERMKPEVPVKFVVMNTVGVDNPSSGDPPRGTAERFVLGLLWLLLPPYADSVSSAAYCVKEIGAGNPCVEWCVVRPDDLLEGVQCEYSVHEQLQSGLFNPGTTTMTNIGHFMADLIQDPAVWAKWKGKCPVILDVPQPKPNEKKAQ